VRGATPSVDAPSPIAPFRLPVAIVAFLPWIATRVIEALPRHLERTSITAPQRCLLSAPERTRRPSSAIRESSYNQPCFRR